MKLTQHKLKKIIKNILNEARLSKSEKELIRLEVELELGEEFELLASQAKDLNDYNRMYQIFLQQVKEETQKRIAAKEAGISAPPIEPLKVKISRRSPEYASTDPNKKRSWEDQFQSSTKQELAPGKQKPRSRNRNMTALPGPTNHPEVTMTPEEDDGNTIDVTNMSLSRRDLLKSMLAGTAAAGAAGVFDPFISSSESSVDELLRVADEHLADLPDKIADAFKPTYDGIDPVMEWDFTSIDGHYGLRYVIRKEGARHVVEQHVTKDGISRLVKKEVLKKGPSGNSNIVDFMKDLWFWIRGTPPT